MFLAVCDLRSTFGVFHENRGGLCLVKGLLVVLLLARL